MPSLNELNAYKKDVDELVSRASEWIKDHISLSLPQIPLTLKRLPRTLDESKISRYVHLLFHFSVVLAPTPPFLLFFSTNTCVW